MELAAMALQQSKEITDVEPTEPSTKQEEHSKTNTDATVEGRIETVAVVTDTVIKGQDEDQTSVESPVDIKIDSEGADKVLSPTETLSTTDSNEDLNSPQSSIESLTVVSGETPSSPSSSLQSTPEELKALQSPSGEVEAPLSPPEILGLTPGDQEMEVKTREKGDLVVVGSGSDRTTPSSDSSHNKGNSHIGNHSMLNSVYNYNKGRYRAPQYIKLSPQP